MSDKARAELAPTGVLRAGINLSNFLLVTGRSEKSEPVGVAPDMAKEIAASLGVPVTYVPFKSPGELADQAGKNVWDIGLIGAEPQRAAVMTFTAAYVEIEATYMVPPGSPLKSIADVDKKGVRIAVSARSAYGLWLENNIKNATLMPISGLDGAFNKFMEDKLDALAGLRPGLLKDLAKHPELKILDGQFTAVQQAVGMQQARCRGRALSRGVRREGQEIGPGGEPDRKAQGQRPVGRPAGVIGGLELAADELLELGRPRIGEQLGGRADLPHLALVHEHHEVGDPAREAHLVRDADHRHAAPREILHHRQHLGGELGIERRGHLVEQHDLRLQRQRAGDGDALLLAAGELLGIGSELVGEADQGQHLGGSFPGLAPGDCFFTRVSASVMLRSTVRCGKRL